MSTEILPRRQALSLLIVVVLAWGFTWIVSKLLLQYMTPLWAVAARSVVGAAALLVLGVALRRVALPVRADIPVILSVGLLHMGAFAALVSLGLQYVPAGRSVVLAYTTPLWVIPAARVFLGEPIGRGRQLGLALGLLGLAVIFNPLAFDWGNHEAVFGNGLVLLAALCWAANIVYVRAHRWVTPPFELAFWQALLASGVLAAVAWAAEGAPRVVWHADLAWLLGYGGVFGIAVAYWAAVNVNRSLPAGVTAIGLLGVPVVGLLCSAAMLHEPLTLPLSLGMAFIVGGIAAGVLDKGRG
ncbi:DMT family transporter [Achromobacter ruhlandii]|uniref:Cystine transporter YijE n=1 Tax=Achromobacter ruhlandii TaxID=72557 RepID=A0ABM8LX61_9BURK|nr:DMT family transporter [Achromobacter ruhlandii]AKP92275.1 Permease of the drug/metabolite transporter (DMT) superfamily [Achromobacter xylosoxidans]AOU95535.1 EamA-like transporter family protein [Achromobacter ruhlandii]MCZ8434147.1 DMT family transporter [Achromobacter ruhlandii]MDC6091706.1 DMT family transporter [Achromobacter ruhlandii]MDC6152914.1 DMT family transporter [Achromobacter ruhlandii]